MKADRFGIVIFLMLFVFGFLIIRVFTLTLAPDKRLSRAVATSIKRGSILDRKGRELAVTTPLYSLYIRPDRLSPDHRNLFFRELSSLGIFTEKELSALFSQSGFSYIRRKIYPTTASVIQKILDGWKSRNLLKVDEAGLEKEEGRFYLQPASAHLVGIVGMDNRGLSGLEYAYEEELGAGLTLVTSIDADLQKIADDELYAALGRYQADSGSIIIMDTVTREVLAMAGAPHYDPNDLKTLHDSNIRPAATALVFEPGSVMKQFSAAFAVNKGYNSPLSPVYTCDGIASVSDGEFKCPVPHGRMDLTRILQKSCNVGMVQVADVFGKKEFDGFLRDFGFGDIPSVRIPENERGILRPADQWSVLSKFMLAIGQEIGVTSLQLAAASASLAGGGIYAAPIIVSGILSNGSNILIVERSGRRVVSADTSGKLMAMMETVVGENGTALNARVEGITIAGKTGTGQVAREDGPGYYSDLYNAVFVGYVPSQSPRLCVVVVLNKPRGPLHQGGEVAAPVFASVLRRVIAGTSYLRGIREGM